jgi:luciferase family oxidoreductase group 1
VNRFSDVPLSILNLSPVRKGHTVSESLRNTIDLAREAERFGYNRYWVAEHHNMPAVASSATAILVGQAAAETSRIKVGAGGIMLPNHAPLVVAEQFGTLALLHPGRIDLGLGRAPGTDPWTARALRRDQSSGADFPHLLAELLGYLAPNGNGRRVRAIPGEGVDLPIWLLGSSTFSAALAAREGLPFVFASHFAPQQLELALEVYRSNFHPSQLWPIPYVMVGVNVLVADTDEEAERQFTTLQRKFLGLIRGDMEFLPPVDDMRSQWSADEAHAVGAMLRESFVGAPGTVRKGLEEVVERTGANELIVLTETWEFKDRLHSYELLADLWLSDRNL